MITIQFLTSQSCLECVQAKKILHEVQSLFPNIVVKEYDVMNHKGLELAVKYGIMANPGVIINDELFSVGNLDKVKFIERIQALQK